MCASSRSYRHQTIFKILRSLSIIMTSSNSQAFQVLQCLYLFELNFIADKLSQNRSKWGYDKRRKSSVKRAIRQNVKEDELIQLLDESWGKEMPSGDIFPRALQFRKMVFGPLGFLKSIEQRTRYVAEVVIDILTKYVKGENLLEKLIERAQDRIPKEILNLTKDKKGVAYESALLQLILAYFSDKKICEPVNKLLFQEEVKMNIAGLFENVELNWIVTRFGLAVRSEEEPINSLANLLRRHYKEEDLFPELRTYSGDFVARLLGYCIMESPENIMRKMFGLPVLRRIGKKLGFVTNNIDNISEAISLILLGLGFDVPPTLKGVSTYRSNIQKHKIALLESRDAGRRSGIMSQIFVEMERLLRDLAHFHISFLWDEQLEDLESDLKDEMSDLTSRQVKLKALDIFIKKKFQIKKPFERLGFGDFISLIKTVGKKVQETKSCKTKMSKSFGRAYVLEKKEIRVLDKISPYRASFTHTNDYPGDEKCDEIVKMVEKLVEEIISRKIYPLVMRMSRSVADEYGKRYAECVDENNKRWLLYSVYLDSSKPYFVYSKTPNIAVSPIIVEKIF